MIDTLLDPWVDSHGCHLRLERQGAAAGGVFPQRYSHQPLPIVPFRVREPLVQR
jgi:hypothetical protein